MIDIPVVSRVYFQLEWTPPVNQKGKSWGSSLWNAQERDVLIGLCGLEMMAVTPGAFLTAKDAGAAQRGSLLVDHVKSAPSDILSSPSWSSWPVLHFQLDHRHQKVKQWTKESVSGNEDQCAHPAAAASKACGCTNRRALYVLVRCSFSIWLNGPSPRD